MGGAAKASDAGKELCEALGIDWHNVYEVVLLYEAGEVVKVTTREFAEAPNSSGELRFVTNEAHDDIIRIMRNYELVEKSVEEI
jgi:hypothetical protein